MALRQQKGRNISQKKCSAFLLQILLHAADFGNIQFDGDSNISYNNTKVKLRRHFMRNINWAVLGTGVIANEMAVALKKNGKNIYAVGNRTHE